ncbi:DUF1972 domain-containing protein [Mangrovimonas futianensis]|uniref:DUF1972 domain-containing protein n=1 Tax=Mangrovimonas futianensis TaxID=2895523 RepID=UPI001E39351D|nr:DUF1972 domain-containing protein [Mangrovimonas futianensis]MCF1420926.1 DUF1972 domain-containing protein [Mangrovimonas futianensis]
MKIGVLGTRGIPNNHGGFEQFAEYFAVYAHNEGHEVFVYNSHDHPFQEKIYKGVRIIKCYDPEYALGTFGQFFYDFHCIIDSRRRNFDVILQLGYTSSSIWGKLFPKTSVVITNMDGLEWKRSKYSKGVQRFLKLAESWAVNTSDYLISDSLGIQKYLKEKYSCDSEYIAYGAELYDSEFQDFDNFFESKSLEYFVLIARMEPENNIEMILDGFVESKSSYVFYVVGNVEATSFGKYLKNKFKNKSNIRFVGAIYDMDYLNFIRSNSRIYFHGHSVGGTNPSLLEAMGSKSFIVAHNNIFNKTILGKDALYFNSVSDVSEIIKDEHKTKHIGKVENNFLKIKNQYNWELINSKYINFFKKCLNERF